MSLSIPYGELEQKFENAKAAIERVREFHKPVDIDDLGSWLVCEGCSNQQDFDDGYIDYPCDTIKALEGKDEYTE